MRAEVDVAARAALQALDTLEKSPSYENLFANVKMFGTKLHGLLQSMSTLMHDLRSVIEAKKRLRGICKPP